MVQKALGDLIVLRLPVPHRMDRPLPQQQDLPLGVSHQNGGVGGNQQLGASTHQPVNFRQQSQLPGGGEGGLRLVQQVDALSPEPVVNLSLIHICSSSPVTVLPPTWADST